MLSQGSLGSLPPASLTPIYQPTLADSLEWVVNSPILKEEPCNPRGRQLWPIPRYFPRHPWGQSAFPACEMSSGLRRGVGRSRQEDNVQRAGYLEEPRVPEDKGVMSGDRGESGRRRHGCLERDLGC